MEKVHMIGYGLRAHPLTEWNGSFFPTSGIIKYLFLKKFSFFVCVCNRSIEYGIIKLPLEIKNKELSLLLLW